MHSAGELATVKVADPSAFTVPDLHYERGLSAPQIVGEGEGGIITYIEPTVRRQANHRDDPIGYMFSRGQVGKAQYRAARQYQATREAEGIGRGRSPSDIREHVDGGKGPSDGLTDTRLAAAKKIARWRQMLGEDGYQIVEAVLIDKRQIRDIADSGTRMMPGKSATITLGHIFRRQLSLLAKDMGFG